MTFQIHSREEWAYSLVAASLLISACRTSLIQNYLILHIIVTVLVLLDFLLVILARGCRAKNPGLFSPPGHRIRDSSRTPDTRAGMTQATAQRQNHRNYLLQGFNKVQQMNLRDWLKNRWNQASKALSQHVGSVACG
jgi:hypothetical protein